MSDQVRPTRLAYVLGFWISRRQTIVRMSGVITPAGGICCPPALPAAAPSLSPPASFVVVVCCRCPVVEPASNFASPSCPDSALKLDARSPPVAPGRITATEFTCTFDRIHVLSDGVLEMWKLTSRRANGRRVGGD